MKLFKSKSSSQGFTLIELLVVIGILGILAGTLFFAINPLEQLDRGNDAARKTASESFVNAANSYYANQRAYPWDTTGAACAGATLPVTAALSSTEGAACVQELIDLGELNDSYDNDQNVLADVSLNARDDGFAVCFLPASTAEQNSPQAQYDNAGTADATCTPGTDCYWCLAN